MITCPCERETGTPARFKAKNCAYPNGTAQALEPFQRTTEFLNSQFQRQLASGNFRKVFAALTNVFNPLRGRIDKYIGHLSSDIDRRVAQVPKPRTTPPFRSSISGWAGNYYLVSLLRKLLNGLAHSLIDCVVHWEALVYKSLPFAMVCPAFLFSRAHPYSTSGSPFLSTPCTHSPSRRQAAEDA